MREPRQFGDALLLSEVSKLINEFRYPDELGGGGAVSIEGGGGAPTVVVAASNATEISKAKADFICSGSTDEDEINEALSLIVLTGGRVLLTEGDFNTTTRIDVADRKTLAGMGEGTRILANVGTTTYALRGQGGAAIRDMRVISQGWGILWDNPGG